MNKTMRRWFKREHVPAALIWQGMGGDTRLAAVVAQLDDATAQYEAIGFV